MTTARMNRASTPVEAATDLMLDERSLISWSLLFGTPHCVQELFRIALLSANLHMRLGRVHDSVKECLHSIKTGNPLVLGWPTIGRGSVTSKCGKVGARASADFREMSGSYLSNIRENGWDRGPRNECGKAASSQNLIR